MYRLLIMKAGGGEIPEGTSAATRMGGWLLVCTDPDEVHHRPYERHQHEHAEDDP